MIYQQVFKSSEGVQKRARFENAPASRTPTQRLAIAYACFEIEPQEDAS